MINDHPYVFVTDIIALLFLYMTKLNLDTDRLATSLERGIVEHDKFLSARVIGPELRLRMPYCGLASIAVSSYLSSLGYKTRVIENTPDLTVGMDITHVLTEVTLEEGTVYIDPTYSQFMEYAGVSLYPQYEHFFPTAKIAVFDAENVDDVIVDPMTHASVSFLSSALFEEEADRLRKASPFYEEGLSTIRSEFAKIWNMNNFELFEPEGYTKKIGDRLARFVINDMSELD